MGHIRLGRLPKTRSWNKVVELLAAGSDISEIAEASLIAAQSGLKKAALDPGFIQVLTTIFKFIDFSTSKIFVDELLKNGYEFPENPGLFDIVSALRARIDSELNSKSIKSDLSEIAQNSFTEILFKYASAEVDSLFEATPQAVQESISKYSKGDRLKILFHDFFSTFTNRYLSYYLSRELSNHVGYGKRFENTESHQEFNEAFDLYIRQSIRIVDEFTPGWFGKAKFEGKITSESVSRYAHVAFKKICSEFVKGVR